MSREKHTAVADFEYKGQSRQVKIYFTRHRFVEKHPYGSTTADEPFREDDIDSYELDGKPVTENQLDRLFPPAFIKKIIEEAIDNV